MIHHKNRIEGEINKRSQQIQNIFVHLTKFNTDSLLKLSENLIEENDSNIKRIYTKKTTDIILKCEIRSKLRQGCALSPFLASASKASKGGKDLVLEKDNVTSLYWGKTKVL